MKRVDAYRALAAELATWRGLPFDQLVGRVGLPPVEREVILASEAIRIRLEIRVRWHDEASGVVAIDAHANGPSTWRLERLQESVLVRRIPE
jgi:hypothetical protein